MFRVDGKIAVVIGGAGGLGEACAKALATQGAKVVVASRNQEKLAEVAKKLAAETGSEVIAMQVDVTDESSVAKLAKDVKDKYGTVDILVNSQGINVKENGEDIKPESYDALLATNVKGVALPCKHFGRIMIEKKKGKIINMSSVRGIRGAGGGNTIYSATKGAVDQITRCLAIEWAQHHINVNAIGPSVTETEMMHKAIGPERLKAAADRMPFKRLCKPEDVGAACAYLASPEADYVHGIILYVDGGLLA